MTSGVETNPAGQALDDSQSQTVSGPLYAPQNPSVDADLLEAAKALIACNDRVVLAMVECGGQVGEDHIAERGADDLGDRMETLRSAIARAESSQGVDASLVEDLGADSGSPTSRRGSHITSRSGDA